MYKKLLNLFCKNLEHVKQRKYSMQLVNQKKLVYIYTKIFQIISKQLNVINRKYFNLDFYIVFFKIDEHRRAVYSARSGPKKIRVTFDDEYSVAPELVNVYTKGDSFWPDT